MRKVFFSLVIILVSISLYGCTEGNQNQLEDAYDSLTIVGDLNNVVSDINLTTKIEDVMITWTSSNELVITNTGKVTRQSSDINVKLTAELKYEEKTKEKEFNLKVLKDVSNLTDQQKVDLVRNNLTLNYDLNNITNNIVLPTLIDGVTISWQSSNEDVVSTTGVVSRYSYDIDVLLTATLKLNDAQSIKQFDLIVIGDELTENQTDRELIDEALEMFDLEGDLSNVTSDLVLPNSYKTIQITWSSSNEEALTNSGEVTQDIDDVIVTLTATLKLNDITDYIRFYVTIKARELTNEEKLTKAVNQLQIKGDLENVKLNLELVYSLYDTTISYQSSNEDIVSNLGVVNRTYQNEDITLSATITIDDLTATKDFTITVLGYTFSTVEHVKNTALNQYLHLNEVVVISKTTTGFFVTDNIDVIYVYSDIEVEVLDKLIISGTNDRHRDLVQLKNVKVTNLGKGEITLEPTRMTVKQLADLRSGSDEAYGYLKIVGFYKDGNLNGIENSKVIFSSNTLHKDALTNFNNKKISVNVFVQWVSDEWEVVLANNIVQEEALDDIEKLDEVKNKLSFNQEVREDLNLLLTLDGVSISWESSNEDVLSNTGVIFRGESDVRVTLTATLTLNENSVTKAFNLVVIQYELSDLEIIEEVKNNLIINADLNNIVEKIPLTYWANNYTVKIDWTSNNPDVVDSLGNIVRQDIDTIVILTANIKLNDEIVTKEFSVIVKAIATISISDALSLEDDSDVVIRDVIVMSISQDGYFITDNTNVMFVYTGYTSIKVSVNDKGLIEGVKGSYLGLQQIKNSVFTKTGTDTVTLAPTNISIEEIYSSENLNGYYSVYGTLIDASTLEHNGLKISLSNKSISLDIIKEFINEDITVNLFAHFTTIPTKDFYFNGTKDDIIQRELTDQEKVEKTISEITFDSKIYDNINLPTINNTYNTTLTWSSSDTTIISNTGVVTRPQDDTEVTLTLTVSSNNINGNKEYILLVVGISSGDILDLTIDFRNNTNMNTSYTTTSFKFFNETSFNLDSLNSTWGGLNNDIDGGIKFGSSSKNGSFTISSTEVTIQKVVLTAKYYDKTSRLVVNNKAQLLTDSFTEYTFEINDNTLSIGSDVKRIWVQDITIFYQ